MVRLARGKAPAQKNKVDGAPLGVHSGHVYRLPGLEAHDRVDVLETRGPALSHRLQRVPDDPARERDRRVGESPGIEPDSAVLGGARSSDVGLTTI